MKISDGYWLTKKGYQVSYATQITEIRTDKTSVTVFISHNPIFNRAMTLGGPVFTVRFSSTMENSIRVTVSHFSGTNPSRPGFELYEDIDFTPVVHRTENGYTSLISGKTSVTIPPCGCLWEAVYKYGDKVLTKSGSRTLSLIEEIPLSAEIRRMGDKELPFFARWDNGCNTYIRDMLGISVGEYIYGFGEKFTPFVKNGQTVEIWNSDGGTCTEQSYKSVPFYVSSRNYGVFVNHTERVSFEIATEDVSRTAFSVQGQQMQYFVFGGDSIAQVISRYTALTGRPAIPPSYSFGLWLSTSFTTDYDENTVLSFIDGMQSRDIPLDVFHFDCFWMKGQRWCDFEWDREMFPDPAVLISKIKERGLRICLWVNPYIGQLSPVYSDLADKGYFIKNRDGSVFQTDLWQPGLSIIDFTNPDARNWYTHKIIELAEMGIDAIKTDFGERIPTDVIYHDGSDPYKMHNYYAYLYNKTVYEALCQVNSKENACLFARAATAGCQQFPVHWGGDCFSDYNAMWQTLRGGLSLCMSGFGFFSHDISGFEATGTPDLYKRWTAFGLLSTHSRYHGSSSYRVPWLFDEESCDVARHFTRLKGRLMPYLYSQAVLTHTTGVPMMRAMAVDFGDDICCLTIDTQYMLGDSLLVAPVFSEDGMCRFYLPEGGIWTDIQTGEQRMGGKWYTDHYDYFGLPLYARPGSIIVFGDFKDTANYNYVKNMNIMLYGFENGQRGCTKIFDRNGNEAAEISAERRGDEIFVAVTGTNEHYTINCQPDLNVKML